LGVPDRFIEQGTVEELHRECGIDVEGIGKSIQQIIADKVVRKKV